MRCKGMCSTFSRPMYTVRKGTKILESHIGMNRSFIIHISGNDNQLILKQTNKKPITAFSLNVMIVSNFLPALVHPTSYYIKYNVHYKNIMQVQTEESCSM